MRSGIVLELAYARHISYSSEPAPPARRRGAAAGARPRRRRHGRPRLRRAGAAISAVSAARAQYLAHTQSLSNI